MWRRRFKVAGWLVSAPSSPLMPIEPGQPRCERLLPPVADLPLPRQVLHSGDPEEEPPQRDRRKGTDFPAASLVAIAAPAAAAVHQTERGTCKAFLLVASADAMTVTTAETTNERESCFME
jgi:hypothetical protein